MFILKILSVCILSVIAFNLLLFAIITAVYGIRAKPKNERRYLKYTLVLMFFLAILLCPVLYLCFGIGLAIISVIAMVFLAVFLTVICIMIFIRSGFLYGLLSLLILLIPIVPLVCILF